MRSSTALYALTRRRVAARAGRAGIRLWPSASLGRSRALALNAFFRDAVLPVLTPLGDRRVAAVPAARLVEPESRLRLAPGPGETAARLAIVQVPAGLARLVPVADSAGYSFVLLEDIIRAHLPQLFPGQADPEVGGHSPGAGRRARARRRRGPHASGAGRAGDAAAARGATWSGSRSRPRRRRSWCCCCASGSSLTSDDVYRGAGPGRSSRAAGADGASRLRGPAGSAVRAGDILGRREQPDLFCGARRARRAPAPSRTTSYDPVIALARRRRRTIPTSWRSSRRSIGPASARR